MIARRNAIAPALTLLLAPALLWVGPATAGSDTPNAQALYEQHCTRCHGPEVYTRPDRKVTSFAALGKQVRQCETMLELRWFDEDVDAVANYLNDKFYKLTP